MVNIPGYKILERLGSGGMAIVYLAEHNVLKRRVAIKVLSDVLSTNQQVRERFMQEARVMATLDHPGIVQVIDFVETEHQLALVMNYVEGRTLDHLIGKEVGPLPWLKAFHLFYQILDAVEFAHENGVIHRDLKPSNIMVTPDDEILIMDFGIAKIAGDGSLTKTGTKLGTLHYMSPEQIKGQKDIDYRTDVYSLGMTLYEMLAGRLPFNKSSDTSEFELMKIIVNGNFPDPRDYYPHIPGAVVECLFDSIALDKNSRISSCTVFRSVLESVNAGISELPVATESNTQGTDLFVEDIAQKNVEEGSSPSSYSVTNSADQETWEEYRTASHKLKWAAWLKYPQTALGKIFFYSVFLVAGVFTGMIIFNSHIKDYVRYKGAVEFAEAGEYNTALREFHALDGYRDSHYQIYEIIEAAFRDYLDSENYIAIANLIASQSPDNIERVLAELNPDAYTIISISQMVMEYYYEEIDFIGLIPINYYRSSQSGVATANLMRSEEERLQPKVIITDQEMFVSTASGSAHAGYAFEVELNGEETISFPWDSLSMKLTEVHNLLSEAYPQIDFHKVTVLVSENIRYQNIVETISIAREAGFNESALQTADLGSINSATRGGGIGFAAYGTGSTGGGAGFVADLRSAASSGAGLASGQSGQALIAGAGGGGGGVASTAGTVSSSDMQAAHQAAQVSFSASASGEAIDLGYRNMTDIRRKINVIKMRVQTAYESLLRSDPGASGIITISFSITPSGSVTGVSVSCPGSLANLQGTVTSAVNSLNFGPAPEQTSNLPVTVPFELRPPQ